MGVVRDSWKFSGRPYIGRIPRHLCDSSAFLLIVGTNPNQVANSGHRELIILIFLSLFIHATWTSIFRRCDDRENENWNICSRLFYWLISVMPFPNKKAVLSQGEPSDAAVNFDTHEFYNKSIMERLCTLNKATLSTRTHLAPNPARNTLNHV